MPRLTFHPNLTCVKFNNAFYKRQTHTRPLQADIQFIEQAKDLIVILGGYAHAIIAYKKDRHAVAFTPDADLDLRNGLVAHELGGVIDQILKDLKNSFGFAIDGRQICLDVDEGVSVL